jgi:AraC-like DNA-binding protein
MRKALLALCIISTLAAADSIPPVALPCIRFLYPLPNSVIEGAACTLSLEVCRPATLQSLSLIAQFSSADRQLKEKRVLGNLQRPPFTLPWNLSDIPNQLFDGMALTAEARFNDGTQATTLCNGVFFINHPTPPPSFDAVYASKRPHVPPPSGITMASADMPASVQAYFNWNKQNLLITVQIKDAILAGASAERRALASVEIGLDWQQKRAAYPVSSIPFVAIPFEGKARAFTFRRSPNLAAFSLERAYGDSSWPCRVRAANGEGYTVEADIPIPADVATPPPNMGCNIIVNSFDNQGSPVRLSWSGGAGNDVYSPFTWGIVRFLPSMALQHAMLWWVALFAGGLGITLGIGLLVRAFNPTERFLRKFEDIGEHDKKWLETITRAIDTRVTDRNLTLAGLAQDLSLRPGTINSMLKKGTGITFVNYVMRARVEIAKERLRSSHTSEAFISDSSGFHDTEEMEKYFKKICQMTPSEFRQKYHIT